MMRTVMTDQITISDADMAVNRGLTPLYGSVKKETEQLPQFVLNVETI